MFIDALGKACPIPVLQAKKALEGGCEQLTIAVDNSTAVANLTRFGENAGYKVTSDGEEGNYQVHFGGEPKETSKAVESESKKEASGNSNYGVFIGKDEVGSGTGALGGNLMKMAIYTLAESDDLPEYMLFMNSGVKLIIGNEPQIIESLQKMMDGGTKVLVCGTCTDFYEITDQVKIGTVSNMYDIITAMQSVGKVITL